MMAPQKLIKNLGKVCVCSQIIIHAYQCGFWDSVSSMQEAFLYWFQGGNLLEDDIFKRARRHNRGSNTGSRRGNQTSLPIVNSESSQTSKMELVAKIGDEF